MRVCGGVCGEVCVGGVHAWWGLVAWTSSGVDEGVGRGVCGEVCVGGVHASCELVVGMSGWNPDVQARRRA